MCFLKIWGLAHELQISNHQKKILQKMEKNSLVDLDDVAQATARDQVRKFVTNLLQQGLGPQQIAEAMTYSAVEMSLQLAGNKLCVVPILLDSMSQAAHAHAAYEAEQQNAEIEVDLCEVSNATFH